MGAVFFNGEDGDQNHGEFCGAVVSDELSWIRFGYGYNMLQLQKTIQQKSNLRILSS